ncbi:MAG: phosphopantothenoylcysteine decarboxylase [Candidatus Omnitrophica bacterium]|nr:phosphopantothenoylcysteine decarboxylase [Candidatus Omnitrophota bacterium]MDD5436179.1 phosphopantothenoylcysteine decarboxylase [Candidatus Omnitrophota bacterium]
MKILVTAGPTRERIDPIRFISNYSTGTFGYEIAGEAARRGHDVILVSGPTCLKPPVGVKTVMVESALDMRREVMKKARPGVCVIMTAAVCDWRVDPPSQRKIKRQGEWKILKLKENPDILSRLGEHKQGTLVGFALETEGLERNALAKLRKKNLDIIVANQFTKRTELFGAGRTDVLIIDKYLSKKRYLRKTKRELAKIILDKVSNFKI